MAQTARKRWLAAAALVATLVVAGLWSQGARVRALWWDVISNQDLTERQQRALTECRDPGWSALGKILAQDLEPKCGPLWTETHLARHARGKRHARLLERLAANPTSTPRQRLRAGMALVLAEHPAPPGLAAAIAAPRNARARDAVRRWLAERDTPGWADPALATELELHRWTANQPVDLSRVARALRHASFYGDPGYLGPAAVDWLGLGGAIETERQRVASNRPVPFGEALGRACGDASSPTCLRALARMVEDADRGEWDQPPVVSQPSPATPLSPFLELLYDGDQELIDDGNAMLGDAVSWVSSGPEPQRAKRLFALFASSRHAHLASGRGGDPVAALSARGGTPWATALGAQYVAERSGVPLWVEAEGRGVILRAQREIVAIDWCGNRFDPSMSAGLRAWPFRAVLAQAAVEAALDARRRSNPPLAMQMADFAERTDPTGAAGAVRGILPFRATTGLGVAAGRLVAKRRNPAWQDPYSRQPRELQASLRQQGKATCPRETAR